uniref:RPN1 N-terminal domain-containing protein n=1 Tax=Aegilops tauschii subsp. strangulata TaxID=200361 RepID=A0A453NAZ2_AEGTS
MIVTLYVFQFISCFLSPSLILCLFDIMQVLSLIRICFQALAILMEYVNKDDSNIRIGAILGLGIAYAGSQKDELRVQLSAILGDPQATLEVLVFTAVALGLVFVGSCNEEIAQSIIFFLMERSEAELAEPIIRLLPVALG